MEHLYAAECHIDNQYCCIIRPGEGIESLAKWCQIQNGTVTFDLDMMGLNLKNNFYVYQIAIISGLFVLAIIFIRSQIWSALQTGCSGFRKNGRSGSTGHFASTEFTVDQTDRDDITLLR